MLLRRKALQVVHQNIRGLQANFLGLCEFLAANTTVDVVTLSETHIANDYDTLYQIPGYTFVKRNRDNGKGGGVAVYIKEGISFQRRCDLETGNIECIIIEICVTKSKNFLVATFYRPPDTSKYLSKTFNKVFEEIITSMLSVSIETIIVGDFNIDFLKANDHRELKNVFRLYGFDQLVTKPTRITNESSTLIDIVATNNSKSICVCDVISTCLSDHEMVFCTRKLNHYKYQPKTITCRNYKNYDNESMNKDLESVNWDQVYNASNVNTALNFFNETVCRVFNKHAPIIEKRVKGRHCPWLNEEIKRVMNDRDKALRKSRKTKSENDCSRYKRLRNRCNNMLKEAKSRYQRNLLNENSLKPDKFWKIIKEVFPSKCKRIATPVINKHKRSEAFKNFFENVVHQLKRKIITLGNLVWKSQDHLIKKTYKKFSFQYISKIFVEKQIKSLKSNKATGLDNLPTKLLRDSATHISKPITHIVNMSIQHAEVPTAWKAAKIMPVHKSGPTSNVENFRPISVLPVLSKILEKAVHTQILEFLETNDLITNAQYGYRRKRSTQLASTLLLDNIRREMDQGKLVGALFID